MAAELDDRLAILVEVRRFPSMGDEDSHSLRFDYYVRMQNFVCRSTYVPFRPFLGMCGENSCNVFLLLFMVLWVPIFATLCGSAVLMLWHTFLFLRLGPVGFFPPCFFLLCGFHFFFL
jgi:hypothetical protein